VKLEMDETKDLKNGMREAVALDHGYPARGLMRLVDEIKSLEAELRKAKSAR